jgi:U4/U6 small nuclear ribonucleoprotein PRP3
VDPPLPKDERPRRERRRFEDVDANGKNGDVKSNGRKQEGELAVNGDLQSGAAQNVSAPAFYCEFCLSCVHVITLITRARAAKC